MSSWPIVKRNFNFPVLLYAITLLCSVPALTYAQDSNERIKQLETQLFERKLNDVDLQQLLGRLSDSKLGKTALAELKEHAQGCQLTIAQFANECPDIDVRELCADLVSQLDEGWRETADGQEFIRLCTANAQSLFSDAWKDFLADGTDQAACEKILAAQPESAWKWIHDFHEAKLPRSGRSTIENGTKADRRKYVLLRLRELSPDDFVAQRIYEFSNFYDAKHVFPAGDELCYRSVGHVQLKKFTFATGRPYHGPEKSFFFLIPKQYQLFQFAATRSRLSKDQKWIQSIAFEVVTYGPYIKSNENKKAPKNIVNVRKGFERSNQRTISNKSIIPVLNLGKEHLDIQALTLWQRVNVYDANDRERSDGWPVPWWWKPYVSQANIARIRFLDREKNSRPPALISDKIPIGIAPTGIAFDGPIAKDDAPSFVVLPPRMSLVSEPDLIAGELACDRVAEELQNLNVQIVNRSFLKQMFEERQRNKTIQPMTGFDAMVSLRLANDQLNPTATLSLIDLSSGSPLATNTFDWPIEETQIKKIQSMLKTSISKIKRPSKKRIRVRLLGANLPTELRFRPLAKTLQSSISKSLGTNRNLMLLEHIEPGSSAEESLLLMLGLRGCLVVGRLARLPTRRLL